MGYYAEQFKLTMPKWNNMYGTQNPTYVPSPMWQNNMYSWNTPWGNYNPIFGNTQSSQPKKELTEKEKKELRKKEKEFKQYKTTLQKELNGIYQPVKQEIQDFKKSIKKDGSVEYVKKLSEMSFGKKLLRGGMNALAGTCNVLKQFCGFDKDGKFHLGKCLFNIGAGALLGALCVYAGPLGAMIATKAFAGAAIAGTAVAAIPTAITAVGLGSGVYIAGRGAVNTAKAIKNDDTKAFDKATQDLGYGATIALTSRAALKKMGGIETKGLFSGTKGCIQSVKNAYQTNLEMHTNFAGNAKGAFTEVYRVRPAKEAIAKFEKTKTEQLAKMQEQLNNINQQLGETTDPKLIKMLKMQQGTLQRTMGRIKGAKSQSDWAGIARFVKHNKAVDETWRNNNLARADKWQYRKFIKADKKFYSRKSGILSDVRTLGQAKCKTMNKVASKDAAGNSQLIADYGWANKNFLGRNFDGLKLHFKDTKNWLTFGNLFNYGFMVLDPLWLLFQPIRSACTNFGALNTGLAADHLFDKSTFYEESSKDFLSKEEVDAKLAEYQSATEELEKTANEKLQEYANSIGYDVDPSQLNLKA